MLGAVFGKNYSYVPAKAAGDGFRFAATNQLALTRQASADMLDDALTNLSWQASLLAEKSSSKSYGTLIDIFA